MAHTWEACDWISGWTTAHGTRSRRVEAGRLVWAAAQSTTNPTVEGLVAYADSAYLSCRILMIASTAVHFEALYCAAQTIEKYMKAILLHDLGVTDYMVLGVPDASNHVVKVRGTHDLLLLAKAVASQESHEEFGDPEFQALCTVVTPLEVAGRYPDNKISEIQYDLSFLTFLDGYVVHCRELLSVGPNAVNLVKRLLLPTAHENPVMQAARLAVRDNNRHIEQLCSWP